MSDSVLRRCRPAMGTLVEIAIFDDDPLRERAPDATLAAVRDAAIDAAFAAVGRVASLMSFHDAASDLSRINAAAHEWPMRVDRWTADVLREARTLHAATDGHFDCTIAPSLVERGLLPRHPGALSSDALEGATFADVDVSDDDVVRFRRPLCIDLGGIAKGHAVDRATDALRAHGVRAATINAGGDLRVFGPTPVPIHVRRMACAGSPASLLHAGELSDGAFATSACFRANDGAQAPSALVRAFDRRVVDTRLTYSVIAPTCTVADALTKALASRGALAAACLRRFDAHPLVC